MSVCGGVPLAQWVKQGHDKGTTIGHTPADDALVAMGRKLLGIKG